MTTLLTITTAVLAVCAVALGWRCARLNRTLNEVKRECEETERTNLYLRDQLGFEEDGVGPYFIRTSIDGRLAVAHTYMVNGVIRTEPVKFFTDPDASFNQREAEELLDKLNEK